MLARVVLGELVASTTAVSEELDIGNELLLEKEAKFFYFRGVSSAWGRCDSAEQQQLGVCRKVSRLFTDSN